MIKILDNNLKRLGVIKNTINASRIEEINGENTLNFVAILDDKLNKLITEDTIFELNNDYFDVVLMRKHSNDDGTYTVEIEAEHVSYRLNDPKYDLETFLGDINPTYVLGQILQSTEFSVGLVEFSTMSPYDIREATSRRKLLMDYVDHLDGEIIFNKFIITIVKKRGNQTPKAVVKDNNVKVISKEVNKRKFDRNGKHLISYTCQPLNLPNDSYILGDAVTLIERHIGIRETLRVVRVLYNPYVTTDVELTFGNYINGFEAPIYDIKMGAEHNGKANLDQEQVEEIVRDVVSDLDIQDIIDNYVYSDTGIFSNAIVKRLRTDLSKPWRYLHGDTTDVHYQDIGDTDISSGRYFKIDKCQPELPPVQYHVPSVSEEVKEMPLWWHKGRIGGGLTTNEEYSKGIDGESTPVMCYQYVTEIPHRSELKKTPEGWWGVRDQWGIGVDEHGRGAGIIEKDEKYMRMFMDSGNGSEIGGYRISVENGPEYFDVDLKMWLKPGSGGSSVMIERLMT